MFGRQPISCGRGFTLGAGETVKRNKRANCGDAKLTCSLQTDIIHSLPSTLTFTRVSDSNMKAAEAFLLAIATSYTHAATPSQELLRPETKQLALTHDLIGFHKNLTQIESVTGNEKGVGEWLASSLEGQGYHVQRQSVQANPERFNVVAWPGKKGNAKLLVTSHIDTVRMRQPVDTNFHS